MSEDLNVWRPPTAPPDLTVAIKRTALGALLTGGVCLYFGFTWLIDAPGAAGEDATPMWFAMDHAIRWALRIIGGAFLVCAALATTGSRTSALLGALVEGAFALALLAIAVETFLEARADGVFDPFVILLLIVMAVGISAAKHSWQLYVRSAPRYEADIE